MFKDSIVRVWIPFMVVKVMIQAVAQVSENELKMPLDCWTSRFFLKKYLRRIPKKKNINPSPKSTDIRTIIIIVKILGLKSLSDSTVLNIKVSVARGI